MNEEQIKVNNEILAQIDALNSDFFTTLDNLKKARPVFTGIDEAFLSVAEKLLNNYELTYRLLNAQYRGAVEHDIAYLEALNDRLVPFRWKTRWLHRPRQNYAADLVDWEADEETKKRHTEKEREIIKKYYPSLDGQSDEKKEPADEEWEIVDEPEEPAEGEKQAENGATGAVAESTDKPEESPQDAPESAEQTENAEPVSAVPTEPEEPAPPKKSRRKKKCA